MIKGLVLFLLIWVIVPFSIINGQSEIKKLAQTYYEAEKYNEALPLYEKLNKINKDPKSLLNRAVCYLKTNKPSKALDDLAVYNRLNTKDKLKFLYAGQAYMLLGDYETAAPFLKEYLNATNPKDVNWVNTIQLIKKCGLAMNLKYLPQLAFVENLGSTVNTENDEFGVIQSPNFQNKYYFSSNRAGSNGGLRNDKGEEDVLKGKYSSDMYMVSNQNGIWSQVLIFEQLLNSPQHDIIQDFNPEGSAIYYLKSKNKQISTLYVDSFTLYRTPGLMPTKSTLPFDGSRGDKDLFIFNDTLLIFSAIIIGGYGGYDLYYATYRDSLWSAPINFGPIINGAFNEVAPNLTRDASKLYFSSDRLETFGGYDFFSSIFEDSNWSAPTNMGLPLNSTGNDVDLELNADGTSMLFASDRLDGYGSYDLYIGYLKNQELAQLGVAMELPFLPSNSTDTDAVSSDDILAISPKQEAAIKSPPREFIMRPFYYKESEELLSPANVESLKKIYDLMIVYPSIKVSFTCHKALTDRIENDLYFSIKRAEKLADYLVKLGISAHRLTIQGAGAHFPVAEPYINGIASTLADRTNNRIDFFIDNSIENNLTTVYEGPAVAVQYRADDWDTFMKYNEGVTFRVNIASVGQMFRNDVLNLNIDPLVQRLVNVNTYLYTLGNFVSYVSAKDLQKGMIKYDIFDAKVVPFYRNKELSRLDAISLTEKYPELKSYLNDN